MWRVLHSSISTSYCLSCFLAQLAFVTLARRSAHGDAEFVENHWLLTNLAIWQIRAHKSTRLLPLLSFYDQALSDFYILKILDEEFSEFSADLGMVSDTLGRASEWTYRCKRMQKCLICQRLLSSALSKYFLWPHFFFPLRIFSFLNYQSMKNDSRHFS